MFALSVPLTASIYGPFGSYEYNRTFFVSSIAQVISLIPIVLFGRMVVAIERFPLRLSMVLVLFVVVNIIRSIANGALFSLWNIDATHYVGRIFSNVSFGAPLMITLAWMMDRHYENRHNVRALREACQAANMRISSLSESLSETFSYWKRELHLETTESRAALMRIADQHASEPDRAQIIVELDDQLAKAEDASRLYWTNGSGLAEDKSRLPRKSSFRDVLDGATIYRPVAPGITAFALFAVLAAWHSFVISRKEALVVSSVIGAMTFVLLSSYRKFVLPGMKKASNVTRWLIFESFAIALTVLVVVMLTIGTGPTGRALLDPHMQAYLVLLVLNCVAIYGGFMSGSMLYIQRLEFYKSERQQIVRDLENELELQNSLSKLLFTTAIGHTPTAGTIRIQEAIATHDDALINRALRESLEIWTEAVAKLSRRAAISD